MDEQAPRRGRSPGSRPPVSAGGRTSSRIGPTGRISSRSPKSSHTSSRRSTTLKRFASTAGRPGVAKRRPTSSAGRSFGGASPRARCCWGRPTPAKPDQIIQYDIIRYPIINPRVRVPDSAGLREHWAIKLTTEFVGEHDPFLAGEVLFCQT